MLQLEGRTLSLNGTITVNPNTTLVLNSTTNTTNQTICGSTNITPISYTFGNGATGATVTGLPAGVTASTSGTTVTISGNPTGVIGTPYNYTITTIGGCGSQNLTGTITLTNGTIPTFTQVLPMCAGATSSPLLTTSNNGITGTWSPAFNNSATDTYTFTPNSGQCALNTQMTIQITPSPTITNVAFSSNICSGSSTDIVLTSNVLNTTYTWSAKISNITGSYVTSGNETNINQIATLTDSENIGTITMVIIPRANGCDGTPITVRIYVNPLPAPTLTDGAICVDEFGIPFQSYTLDSGLDNATYDFVWYFNGVAIPNSNNATYTANAVGTYGVIATNSVTNCVSSDVTTMVTANVTSVTPTASMAVTQSAYFSGNATLIVNVTGGSGTLMYSLDEGTLQSSNVFTNVSSGPHTITVIDTQGCTYLTYTLLVIDYPQYFTPNGDGINDTWYIAGLQNTDVINIFDRYGKLIKQLKGVEFWDGTYNQELLPSTDYWFTLDYMENGVAKTFKAHFTMKR